MSGPTPPRDVIAAVAGLKAAFDDLHDMHECSEDCPEDCGQSDYSESAYRYHDEHNADVREDIEMKAGSLVDALETWLGAATLLPANAEDQTASDGDGPRRAGHVD